jgi:hypothetical protein
MNVNASRSPALLLSLLLAALHGASGCRFQREPAASPFAADASLGAVELPSEPIANAGRGADADGGGGGRQQNPAVHDSGGLSAGAGGTAGAASSGGTGGAAGAAMDRDASVDPPIADSDASASCAAPTVAVCNPVTNQGCPDLMMQCAVDPAAPVLSGYCIFSAPMDAGPCLNTLVTESCPPTSTCLGGECRTLCFCDTDCDEGQCCVEPVGNLGFKVCGDC